MKMFILGAASIVCIEFLIVFGVSVCLAAKSIHKKAGKNRD